MDGLLAAPGGSWSSLVHDPHQLGAGLLARPHPTAPLNGSAGMRTLFKDIIPLLSSIYAPTETRVVVVCLSKLKQLILQ